ncbi:hypothetical protein NMY22_g15070 [Coprinellus aureogranulatus]|nr:hypothetical protein NMY22_g15070 [Coprinellus aureogranulatus]
MDSELYGSGPYGVQIRSSVRLSSDGHSQGPFVSDSSGYTLHPSQTASGYQASPYLPIRDCSNAYSIGQEPYPTTVYPESAQRTGSGATISLGQAQDAETVNQLSNFDPNQYEAAFDF